VLTASLRTRRIGFPYPATKDVVLALRLRRRATAGVPRPVGATSIALKLFLIVGTVGLFVWAGFLPEADEATPLGWSLLLSSWRPSVGTRRFPSPSQWCHSPSASAQPSVAG
jgi:hypothetical protein